MESKLDRFFEKIGAVVFPWFEKPVFQYMMTFLYSPIGWWALWKYGKQNKTVKILLTVISLPFAFMNIFCLSWIGIPVLLILYFASRPVKNSIKAIVCLLSILPTIFSAMMFFSVPSSNTKKDLQVADVAIVSSETSVATLSSQPILSEEPSIPISPSVPESVAEPIVAVEPSQTPSIAPPISSVAPTPSVAPPVSSVASAPPSSALAPAPSVAATPSTAPAPASSTTSTTPAPQTPAPATTVANAPYIGNRNPDSMKFHLSTCGSVDTMKDSNKVPFQTRDEAINAGYTPCKKCNP